MTQVLKAFGNKMTTKKFHKLWLKVTAIIVGSFGPIFFLGTMPEFSMAASWTMDLLSWPVDGKQDFLDPTTRFLSALTGGFLFGWGIMIWYLSVWVYDKAPEPVRKSVVVGILAWFVLDSAGSIASGNTSNLFFNSFIACLAIGPLWSKTHVRD